MTSLSLQEVAEEQKRDKASREEEKLELERLRAQTEQEKEERDRLLAQAEEEKKEKDRFMAQAEDEKKEKERLMAQAEDEKKEKERFRAQAEDEKKEKERFMAQAEEQKKEKERLRTESAATKEEQAKVINKAEAERLRLEEENLKLKQEKEALEKDKADAEKAYKEKEELLEKVLDQIKGKEAEIAQKEDELMSVQGTSGEQEEGEIEVQVKIEVDDETIDLGEDKTIELSDDDAQHDATVVIPSDVSCDEDEPLDEDAIAALDAALFGPGQMERDTMADNNYWFTRPATFSEARRNQPSEQEFNKILPTVPAFVGNMILQAMPEPVITGQPQLVLWYNIRGILPNWIVIWFMRALRKINSRCSDEALFYKALTLIDAWREREFYGGNVEDVSP